MNGEPEPAPERRLWSVRALWLTVALIWLVVWWVQGYPAQTGVIGVVACLIFSRRGFLAGKHGVYR